MSLVLSVICITPSIISNVYFNMINVIKCLILIKLKSVSVCICMLRGSKHYCAIAPRVLSHHIVDFLRSRRMEIAPTSIEVLLRPTLVQSDERSDLRASLSSTTRYRCTHVLVYTAPGTGSPRRSPIQLWTGPRRCLTSVIEQTPMS